MAKYKVGRRREYSRYVKKFKAAKSFFSKSGIYEGDTQKLSFKEYFERKKNLKSQSKRNFQSYLLNETTLYQKRKAYTKYLELYNKTVARIKKYGATPYNESQGLGAMSFQNFITNRQQYLDAGSKTATRDVVNQQVYKFTYKQAVSLHKNFATSEELGEEYGDYDLISIRTGNKFDLDILKDAWKEMKKLNKELPEDERKSMEDLTDEFEMDWFGYTQ